jgi:pSer/pThr/pTyr-binding forkhead associated (FHA) protein
VCVVEDAGSFNGTYVDGVPIMEPTDLESGSVIQLGADGPSLEYSSITSR